MSIIRVANPDDIRPGHVVMIVLVVATLAGSCLLTSGAERTILPDGAREWPPNSWFRVLVETLNLNYAQPTPTGSEIKNLVFGLGTAFAVLSVGTAMVLRPRSGEDVDERDTIVTDPDAGERIDQAPPPRHVHPLFAAQVLMLLYVAWSFASIAWSDAPDIALYGSLELAGCVVWSFALAYGLNRASARFGAVGLAAVAAATAAMAVGYTIERNPTLRASYPIGNPTFLAACLIPGMLIAACLLTTPLRQLGSPRRFRGAATALLWGAVLVVMGAAFWRASPRGAAVGLAAGVLAMLFIYVNRRGKLAVLVVSVVCAALAAVMLLPRLADQSSTGRDASLRLRYYAWNYALELIGERKLLGHGQGGYVRKADALASGDDVLNDPEALTARIAHTHNEWLEVWTDLGSVGLVVVLGTLFFTLTAGATTARRESEAANRRILIALLASLTALIAEEMFGVGLRVTGLPPVYYTVIGLIWAFCMPERPAAIRALRRNTLTRTTGTAVTTVLAFAVAFLSLRDFTAARAQFEVAQAIDNLEWERALELAASAREHRLSPQRRLTAQDLMCATYLHVARVYQVNGLRRAATAMQNEPYDEPLLALADEDVRAAGFYHHRGTELLQDLVRSAPNFYNSNWLEYGFEQIRAEFARARGDFDAARQYDQNSAAALKREIARRPYDANMAALYVTAAGSGVSLEGICAVLARPLRYNRAPAAYHDIVRRFLTIADFPKELVPIYDRARSADPTGDPASWDDPFAPETLRLAAIIWFEAGDDDRAEGALDHACSLYAAFQPRLAYATAVCLAELAEQRFFNRPLHPDAAIREAEEAIKRAPPSYEGRQLIQAVQSALVGMHLASGDEASARRTLVDLAPGNDERALRVGLSDHYARLASMFMRRDGQAHSEKLGQWVDRAIELCETNELAWRLKADIAFRDGDDAGCVHCLRQARRHGAADTIVHRFVDIALQHRPTSKPLVNYSKELGAELGGPPSHNGSAGPES